MSHTDPTAAQQRAARVLVTLLGTGLPPADWSLSQIIPDELTGHLERGGTAGLQAWAEAFGAEVDWQRHRGCRPRVIFEVNGVSVQVWTYLPELDESAGGER
ncbi:hypothetical protein HDA32_004723 [Spinactinospora alkalitolerans]|uniref:Uncharacterized protein n=1 Tax=Spinactinospora alkalitolerans TaxID=687207 RepID=A0A852U3W5_9ACTN|nr:hypothetical protein [Spinactinospora alkalitolerans]NYE49603.1 hypothetical protein [Spinactinospora alkalitolerans]